MARAAIAKSRPTAKRSARKTAPRRPASATRRGLSDIAGLPPERQIAMLKKDRDALVAALDAAETRAATLETRLARAAGQVMAALETLRQLAESRR
jgi:hypothetical protein